MAERRPACVDAICRWSGTACVRPHGRVARAESCGADTLKPALEALQTATPRFGAAIGVIGFLKLEESIRADGIDER